MVAVTISERLPMIIFFITHMIQILTNGHAIIVILKWSVLTLKALVCFLWAFLCCQFCVAYQYYVVQVCHVSLRTPGSHPWCWCCPISLALWHLVLSQNAGTVHNITTRKEKEGDREMRKSGREKDVGTHNTMFSEVAGIHIAGDCRRGDL